MERPTKPLHEQADALLLSHLTPDLKATIDGLLDAGRGAAEILARVREQTGGPQSPTGGLTYLAVEAYLERR